MTSSPTPQTSLASLEAVEEGVVLEYLHGPEGEVTAVYLVPFHRAEVSLATGLLRLLHTTADHLPSFAGVDWRAALGWLQSTTGNALASAQEEAVRLALTQKVAVLTGGLLSLSEASVHWRRPCGRRARDGPMPPWPSGCGVVRTSLFVLALCSEPCASGRWHCAGGARDACGIVPCDMPAPRT